MPQGGKTVPSGGSGYGGGGWRKGMRWKGRKE